MTSDWDAMWRKPFDDAQHYATAHLSEPPASITVGATDALRLQMTALERLASTTTTEYRAAGVTVWHEQDARAGDEAWREREGRA